MPDDLYEQAREEVATFSGQQSEEELEGVLGFIIERANEDLGVTWSEREELGESEAEELLSDIDACLRAAMSALRADSFSISVGFPLGISVGLSWG